MSDDPSEYDEIGVPKRDAYFWHRVTAVGGFILYAIGLLATPKGNPIGILPAGIVWIGSGLTAMYARRSIIAPGVTSGSTRSWGLIAVLSGAFLVLVGVGVCELAFGSDRLLYGLTHPKALLGP